MKEKLLIMSSFFEKGGESNFGSGPLDDQSLVLRGKAQHPYPCLDLIFSN